MRGDGPSSGDLPPSTAKLTAIPGIFTWKAIPQPTRCTRCYSVMIITPRGEQDRCPVLTGQLDQKTSALKNSFVQGRVSHLRRTQLVSCSGEDAPVPHQPQSPWPKQPGPQQQRPWDASPPPESSDGQPGETCADWATSPGNRNPRRDPVGDLPNDNPDPDTKGCTDQFPPRPSQHRT